MAGSYCAAFLILSACVVLDNVLYFKYYLDCHSIMIYSTSMEVD
ncbi:hypothetical protein KNP414_04339 [Paenibacillus mucilaginosus KNP414]|uniref:Uncharacterized protein n=1 Tax=Paenibacillus mucilaginosus (strain KNP414) TaxID=1036673 RepID=F8FJM1_PAEMK|nr:hypothetical protein KNP414_04339 [Paenibacillus mucilaginosus KNP414]